MTPRSHELKTVQPFFDAVVDGSKTFELRMKDGRDYRVGDELWLREWDGRGFTGASIRKRVTYLLDGDEMLLPGYLPEGVVVMGLAAVGHSYSHRRRDGSGSTGSVADRWSHTSTIGPK